ncbi:pleiotropic drug resistance protein 1-like [Fagus crenata]
MSSPADNLHILHGCHHASSCSSRAIVRCVKNRDLIVTALVVYDQSEPEASPKKKTQAQSISETKLSSRSSTKDTLDASLALATEIRSACEKPRASFSTSNRQILGSKWFLQLKDGGKMEILGLEHSPWDYVRSKYGVGLGRWWSEMLELRSTFPMVDERVLGDSSGENKENQEQAVVVVDDDAGALMIEPLAVDWSMADQMTLREDQEQYRQHKDKPYSFVTVQDFAKAFQSFHVGRRLKDELAAPCDKRKSNPVALATRKISIVALITATLILWTKMHCDAITETGALFFTVVVVMFNGFQEMSIAKLPELCINVVELIVQYWGSNRLLNQKNDKAMNKGVEGGPDLYRRKLPSILYNKVIAILNLARWIS